MNNQEAQKIVDNEDYLPWSLVAEARKVLGTYEQTAEEIYAEKLNDPRWEKRRQQILIRDRFRCMNCNCNENLQVHHRQYHYLPNQKRFIEPWDYSDEVLITLCADCHRKGHAQYVVPVKFIHVKPLKHIL